MSTENVAQFISETKINDIPQAAVKTATLGITDFIGVTLAGTTQPVFAIIKEFLAEMGGTTAASVIGGGFKTSPYFAALANGTLGHALDYDDMHRMWTGHPSVALAPAVLAVGEKLGASGMDVLGAYIIGFEVCAYIGVATGLPHYEQGWHNTSTIGSLGAAAAVARLLKLDPHQTRTALGIAASWAGGLRQNFGTMTKPLHAGAAASNGVLAGFLAQKGFTADQNILEAPLGFAKVLGNPETDWEKADAQLEQTFTIVSHATVFKPYPSCGCTHPAIEAALVLTKQHALNAGDIDEIEVAISPLEPKICIYHEPATALEGKFSLEYCVAVSVLDGKALLRQFSDERAKAPELQDLIRRVKLVQHYPMTFKPGQEKLPQRVTIKRTDGREFSCEISYPKGSPQNPLSTEEFNAKYRDCASLVLPRKAVDRSLELLLKMEELEDFGEVIEMVSARSE